MSKIILQNGDCLELLKGLDDNSIDIIFCDPPYGKNLAPEALLSTLAGGWVTNNALFVVEERADVSVELPAGLVMLEQRNYGDTQIIFARFKG